MTYDTAQLAAWARAAGAEPSSPLFREAAPAEAPENFVGDDRLRQLLDPALGIVLRRRSSAASSAAYWFGDPESLVQIEVDGAATTISSDSISLRELGVELGAEFERPLDDDADLELLTLSVWRPTPVAPAGALVVASTLGVVRSSQGAGVLGLPLGPESVAAAPLEPGAVTKFLVGAARLVADDEEAEILNWKRIAAAWSAHVNSDEATREVAPIEVRSLPDALAAGVIELALGLATDERFDEIIALLESAGFATPIAAGVSGVDPVVLGLVCAAAESPAGVVLRSVNASTTAEMTLTLTPPTLVHAQRSADEKGMELTRYRIEDAVPIIQRALSLTPAASAKATGSPRFPLRFFLEVTAADGARKQELFGELAEAVRADAGDLALDSVEVEIHQGSGHGFGSVAWVSCRDGRAWRVDEDGDNTYVLVPRKRSLLLADVVGVLPGGETWESARRLASRG